MTDQKFVGDFIASLAPFQKKLDDNFEGTHVKPVLLDKMDVHLPSEPKHTAQTVTVTLRSIRAPKFSVEYQVPDTDSIFAVKERLLTDPNGPLAGAEYGLAGIKLMIKSRAISDTRQLRELASTEFTVMLMSGNPDTVPSIGQLYWSDQATPIETAPVGAPSSNTPATSVSSSSNETEPATEPAKSSESAEFPAEMWKEIAQVLAKYTAHSEELVAKFKQASK